MIIIFGAAVVITLGYVLNNIYGDDWFTEIACPVMAVLAGVVLILSLIGLTVTQMTVRGEMAAFTATKEAVEIVRARGGVEPAALSIEISRANGWLASARYYRGTIFRDFYPADLDKLEPIR